MRLAGELATMLERAAARIRGALHAMHVIVGGPDYDGYLAHVRTHHPGTIPVSREEFERGQHDRRTRPGARCC